MFILIDGEATFINCLPSLDSILNTKTELSTVHRLTFAFKIAIGEQTDKSNKLAILLRVSCQIAM